MPRMEPIGGLGTAGPFSNVLFLPNLRVNLFSQKHDGWKITHNYYDDLICNSNFTALSSSRK
jgi:hypothetical protein